MLNVLLIGFSKDVDFKNVFYKRYPDKELNLNEIMNFMNCLKSIDVIVVNLDYKLSIDQALVVQTAYTRNILIYGVGKEIKNKFLKDIIAIQFNNLAELNNYLCNERR